MPQKHDVSTLLSDLNSLTALRTLLDTPGLCALRECLCAALAKDMPRAHERFHEMFAHMLKIPRITGEIFRDYWLYNIIICKGLAKRADDVSLSALQRDLAVAQLFCGIGGKGIYEYASRPAKNTQAGSPPDAIMRLSAQAWGGASAEQVKNRAPVQKSAGSEGVPPLFQYSTRVFALDLHAQDEIFQLIGEFEREADWTRLAHSVLSLHAAHGDIALFSHRRMYCRDGALVPMQGGRMPAWNEFVGLEAAQGELARMAADFSSGRGADNVFLHGEQGLGKTALAASLAEAFPLRLIVVRAQEFDKMSQILTEAAKQPMRFIVLVDDVETAPPALLSYATFEQTENVWLIGTGRTPQAPSAFHSRIILEAPPLKAFIKRVMELARSRGAELDYDMVQDVCIDWKVDGGELTASAALKVVGRMTE